MATDLSKDLGLENLFNELEKNIKAFKELISISETFSKSVKDVNSAIVSNSQATEKNNKNKNDEVVIDKELEKIKKQLIDTQNKIILTREKDFKNLEKAKIALNEKNKAVRDEIKEEKASKKNKAELNSALTDQSKSLKEATEQNKILRKATLDLDLTTQNGRNNLKLYNDKIDENTKFIKENVDEQKKQSLNIGNYQSAVQKIIPFLGLTKDGLKNMAIGLKNVGLEALKFIASPLGIFLTAISTAFLSVKKALTATSEGQERLSKLTGLFSGILGGLSEIVIKLGEGLIYAFTEPKKAINELISNLKNRLLATIEGLSIAGSGLLNTLIGAFTLNNDTLNKGLSEIKDGLSLAAKNGILFGDVIEESINKISKAAQQQGLIDQKRFQLENKRINFITKEAKLLEEISAQKRIIEDTTKTTAERERAGQIALENINKLNEAKLNFQMETVKLLELEQSLTSNTQEDNRKLQEEKAKLFQLEKEANLESITFEKRLTQIRKEEFEKQKTLAEENKKKEKEANLKAIEENKNAEILKNIELYNNNEISFKEFNERKLEIDKNYLNTKNELLLNDVELQNFRNEQEISAISKKYETDKLLAEQTTKYKDQSLTDSLNFAKEIFKGQGEAQKAAGIASATIDTAIAIGKASASAPFPFNVPAIAKATFIGAAQISKIVNTPIPSFADGTKNAPKGIAEVGEAGFEILENLKGEKFLIPARTFVNLEGGEKIYSNKESKNMIFNDNNILKELKGIKNNMKITNNINIISKEPYFKNYKKV